MEKFYIHMLSWIRQKPWLEKIIVALTKYFPYITFCIYPCVLIYLFGINSPLLWDTFWRPLAAFLLVSVIRKIINRPRPYESMPITPLVGHKTGESFPSRHTVSSMIIALVCFPINAYLGIFALTVAIILSGCRILAGVHFVSDVVVSVIIALFFYFI
ncbi:MAG: phosphatase PAP2 family protein [Longibaculum sp.]